ncbi:MAG TPA: PIN domain-containing protein [Rubrivivax sp.]|nr:PIN domain-containing protein [Rubrivivax sp.]
MSGDAFFDTNVPLYLLSTDSARCARAEDLLAEGGTISVQVLNEFAAVARRKHALPWPAIEDLLAGLKQMCRVLPLTLAMHERAIRISRRFGLHVYDSTIVASALEAGCSTLYTQDLQHGQRLEGLTVLDPFR